MPRSTVVPLVTWTPGGNVESQLQEHTLTEVFDFVERAHYARRGEKHLRHFRRIRTLCSQLPDHPCITNIIGLVDSWRRYGYTEWTVYQYWNMLNYALTLSAKLGFSRGNPAAPLELRRPDGRPHHIQNIRELWPRFLDVCEGPRERLFLALTFQLCLRRGEAIARTARDVSVDRDGVWWLQVYTQRPNPSKWETTFTKSKAGMRELPLRAQPEVQALLTEVLALGPATVRVGRGGGGTLVVPFLCPYREHDLADLGERLRAVDEDAFPRNEKMWHALRDTGAVEMHRAGCDLSFIRTALGHASEYTTTDHYLGNCGRRARVDVFDGVWGGGSPGRMVPPGTGPPVVQTSGASPAVTGGAPRPETRKLTHGPRQENQPCNGPKRKRSGMKAESRRPKKSGTTPSGTGGRAPAFRVQPQGQREPSTPPEPSGRLWRTQRALPGLAVGPVMRRPRR